MLGAERLFNSCSRVTIFCWLKVFHCSIKTLNCYILWHQIMNERKWNVLMFPSIWERNEKCLSIKKTDFSKTVLPLSNISSSQLQWYFFCFISPLKFDIYNTCQRPTPAGGLGGSKGGGLGPKRSVHRSHQAWKCDELVEILNCDKLWR